MTIQVWQILPIFVKQYDQGNFFGLAYLNKYLKTKL